MKIALFCNHEFNIPRVYPEKTMEELRRRGELLDEVVTSGKLNKHADFLRDCEYIFSTWGMPELDAETIRKYLPNLKAVFYAAGSVQKFARPFLDCGIDVFSAWKANGVPVAEFTFAQIVLANKGYFMSAKKYRKNLAGSRLCVEHHPGNYDCKIGIIGTGCIGSLVCEKLKTINCEVLAYDPFLPKERAELLGIRLTNLKEIFNECDVISNHLANKPELDDVLNYDLFRRMKPYSTFINTGRGAQVSETGLAKALREDKTRIALLDVTKTDILTPVSPLFGLPNVFPTPHMAGSSGKEVRRMSAYMIEEFDRYLAGEETKYRVTPEMLATMA